MPLTVEFSSQLAKPLGAQLASVWELVASIPAPRRDHCQHQDPALAQQVVIDSRIVFADFFRGMGEIELDRATATRLEVNEEQPVIRAEHVAWVWLTVQDLLSGATITDHLPQAAECVAEELPVGVV